MNATRLFIITLLVLFSIHNICAQTYELKKTITPDDKKELLNLSKELFEINVDFSYSITSKDAATSFSEMSDGLIYNEDYLKKNQKELLNDSLNPVLFNNIGNYYSSAKKVDLANHFFQQSYNHLKHLPSSYLKNDSAFYYSFRGILKMNLGMENENAIEDIKKAMEINPNDSIALAFYPYFLISSGKFEDARKLCTASLNTKSKHSTFWYIMLVMTDAFEGFQSFVAEIEEDEKLKIKYRSIDYNKLIDFKLINKYADKYKEDVVIQNARTMADLLALLPKVYLFERIDDFEIVFEFTSKEAKKIKSIEKGLMASSADKTMNEYTLNKNFGYVYFMLDDLDKSIDYFNKAIELFPIDKQDNYFTSADSYNALLTIHLAKKDTLNFQKTLEEKIKVEPNGTKSVIDIFLLANLYFKLNELDSAQKWCKKATKVDAKHFETLRLLAHLDFVKGFNSMAQYYLDEAIKHGQSMYDQYLIAMQYAIYYIHNGADANSAYNYIKIAKESLEGNDCELCDTLIENYIKTVPEK